MTNLTKLTVLALLAYNSKTVTVTDLWLFSSQR